MTEPTAGDALLRRLEEAFRRVTGAKTPRGARAWIAGLARLDRRSVARMLAGEIPPDRILATLDAIEAGRAALRRERYGPEQES